MRMVRAWVLRLKSILFRRTTEQDFLEQIRADIELHTEDGIQAGMTPQEARRAALVKFGGVDAATEAWREQRGIPFFETLFGDVAYALRVLRRNKGWASVFILSLALGIGANAAIFSGANIQLFRNLPVPDARNLVALRWRGLNSVITGFADYGYVPGGVLENLEDFSFDNLRAGATGSYPTFRRLSAANETLEQLFAVGPGPTINLIVDGQGETASTQFVSGAFYSTLRIPPAAGRLILPTDDQPGAAPVVVISHGYWRQRFGASPNIVGKQVRINALSYTIIGVSGAPFPNFLKTAKDTEDVSIPLVNEPTFDAESKLDKATDWWLVMMGRLKRGVNAAQVQANLGPIYEQASRDGAAAFIAKVPAEDVKDIPPHWGKDAPKLEVASGARGAYDVIRSQRNILAILGVLAGIVLASICANLTNLSLAFATARQREIAVRQAIGASRRRLIRQILTEHLVIALLGGAASLLVVYFSLDLVGFIFLVEFDWSVVLFAFAAATVTGLVIGIVPALRASQIPGGSLNVAAVSRRSRLATGLLLSQVALSFALLIGAGLFLRTLINLQKVNPGFDVGRLAAFSIQPGFNQYDETRTKALYEQITTNLRALPGVSSITFSSEPLLSTLGNFSEMYPDRAEQGVSPVRARRFEVGDDFFQTTGIPLRAGRDFDSRDNSKAPQVAIVNEALAAALFGNENPIGRHFGGDDKKPTEFEIVGVAANAWHTNFRTARPFAFYRPYLQASVGPRTFEVRTMQPPELLLASIRQIVQKADSSLPIIDLSKLSSAAEQQWFQERLIALASGSLGGLAIVVSMVGLFGLMSYAVTRRTKEIAIRMALGAESSTVLRSILGEYLLLVSAGVLVGLALALAASRFLKTFLFGLAPTDPLVIVGSILLMLVVAAIAAYTPARRAARVDPMTLLRHE